MSELSTIRKILCPIDFSPFSRRALDYAVALARAYKAEIEALHVFPLMLPMVGDLTYTAAIVHLDESTRKTLSEDLHLFAQPAKEAGIPTMAVLTEGDPSTVILERAKGLPSGIIVMGTHGLRGFDRWFMGSVAQRVVRKADCPVLTVPQRSDKSPSGEPPALKNLLCPLDLSEHSAVTLEYAVSMARASNAGLTILHVMDGNARHHESAEARARLPFLFDLHRDAEARSRWIGGSLIPGEIGDVHGIERIVVKGRAHEEILRIAAERRPDLIVMGVHGRKSINLPFFGSTVQHVLQQAECPVLTIRPR